MYMLIHRIKMHDYLEAIAWSNGPAFPEARAQAAALLAPNNTIMLFEGDNPANSVLVPKLNPEDVVWGTASDLNTSRTDPGAVRFGNSGILIVCCTGNGETSDEVLTYDYSFGDSQDVAKMAVARLQFAYANDIFGSPNAIGVVNDDGDVLFDVELFDPGSNTWMSIIDLPDAQSAASTVGNDFIDFSWTATTDAVGVDHYALAINVTVVADVPKLSVKFNPNSGGMNYAVTGIPFAAQVNQASSTPRVYSLVHSPVGMSIDQTTCLINWLPAAEQSGLVPVTVRASSAAGSTDFNYSFYSHFTGSVSVIQVTDVNAAKIQIGG